MMDPTSDRPEEARVAIAPEYISPEPMDVHEFGRRARETFNLGKQYVPDVGTVLLSLKVDVEGEEPSVEHFTEVLRTLRDKLTQIDDERFKGEMADAVIALAVTEDLRPLLGVLSSWFRTTSLEAHPKYEAAAAWARSVSDDDLREKAVDAEEMISRLGLEDTE